MQKIISILILLVICSQTAYSQEDSASAQNLYNRIISLDDEVRNNPGQQVNNFNPNDSASLPIGIVKKIGNTVYIICVDSARFTPQGAFFSVYMALDMPDSDQPVAFAAKNVQFNPQGVIVSNGARLQLVSKQVVNLGPKVKIEFKDDGNNFIEWDCNGYKQAGLSLDFVFDQGLFENASNPAQPVTASMQLVVQDLNDISFMLNEITPFKVKGAKDFIFHLQNVVIDRSEFSTPSGVNLSPETVALYNGSPESWKGFYAENAVITFPEKLSKENQPPTQVYAHNIIIDDSGLTGAFGANNLFSTAQGSMNGKWAFSLDNIQVDLANNHVTGGSLGGKIAVPPLDNTQLDYSATVMENTETNKLDYEFTVSPDSVISINAFKSRLALAPSSKLTVQSVGDKFVPSALLNGSWTVDFEKAEVSGIAFQNILVTTDAPYINSGTFSLVGNAGKNLIGLPISINTIGMNLTSQNQLSFAVGVEMSLGSDPQTSTSGTDTTTNVQPAFGVSTTFRINTIRETNFQGKEEIAFNSFSVDDIAVESNTSVFELAGVISIRNEDPTFGDLFYGSLSLKINKFLKGPIMVSAGFGKIDGYKYWFTDASLPVEIPIITGSLNITSLYGGVQNRVASTQTTGQMLNRVMGQINTNSSTAIPFTPDQTQGLLFRAGVGIANPKEEVFNGEALLTIAFNPSGGFEYIDFSGRAFMMVKRTERNKANVSKAWGNLGVHYDNSEKVFDANMDAAILVPQKLTGAIDVSLHIDSTDWYFWLNRPSNRAYLNLVDVFNVNAYFMIGTIIDPIPAPPSYVTSIVGGGTIGNIDLNEVGNGNGFATGLEFGINFGGEFPEDTKWRGFVALNVGGGFDLMMMNAENARCSGSTDPIGVNGYYCMGQVYAYLDGSLGARKYKDNGDINTYQLGSLQVAALLQGKLPKPTFVYGAVGIRANILNVIDFTFTADVEFGDNCQLIGM